MMDHLRELFDEGPEPDGTALGELVPPAAKTVSPPPEGIGQVVARLGKVSAHQQTLFGRDSECDVLNQLLAKAVAPRSQVLVVRGESGIGKTALLDHLASSAAGWRVARTWGIEAEMELAYGGLQQLCAPMADQIERLPAPQRSALATACGLSAGGMPDRFLVGLGVLGLLAELASEQPLLCIVDDVQWLDAASAQTLSFVGSRLQAEPIVMVFGARTAGEGTADPGFPELELSGLEDTDARALLESALRAPLDPAVREQLVAEARGNPLALLELPRGLSPTELAGGFALPNAMPVGARLESAYVERLAGLPTDTQQLVLIAAAEPLGDPVLLWRAAGRLGIEPAAVAPATTAGLLDIGLRVRFRHPLVRSTVYRTATGEDRRRAHQALADATDGARDPDRRAWHLACAAPAPDEQVADELERSARRASARGGTAAAAAFLIRSVELSQSAAQRGARALAAARLTIDAGAPDAAGQLLGVAERSPLSDVERAQVERLRAELSFVLTRGSDAPALLLNAAQRLDPLDAHLARETYLEALSAAQFAGRLAVGVGVRAAAEAARAAPARSGPPRAPDLLLDGLALRFTEGSHAGAPILKRALRAFRSADLSPDEGLRWLFRASTTALDLWDDEAWEFLASRHVRLARDAGALAILPLALTIRTAMHVFAGELTEAAAIIGELNAVTEATGGQVAPYGELVYAAWRGREPQAQALMEVTQRDVTARGEGVGLSVIEWGKALLASAVGAYDRARELGQRASEHPDELGISTWGLVEVIEASSRLADLDSATDGLRRLSASTAAAGTDWALGIEARSRALVSTGEEAERDYRRAIELLARTRVRPELARSHLVYGEWLRRARRRVDAREQLRTAHDLFVSMGVEGFAERARRELLATGETVRKRSVETSTDLTPQEEQIARLAAELHRNSDIAAKLFLSPRTVEWHLRKVFTKLGVTSRRELRSVLEHGPGFSAGSTGGSKAHP
jgi:DNA-binding CsgD family transcriptional regulator